MSKRILNPRITSLIVVISFFGLAVPVCGHPDIDSQILALSARIQSHPLDAELYLRRADLRRQYGQFDFAREDIATAARLKPALRQIQLERARVEFDSCNTDEALRFVNNFLATEPRHAPALELRGRCEERLGKLQSAIDDFTAALNLQRQPNPDLYVARARLQSVLGRFDDAINGLDAGINRLGPLPGLQLAAVSLERQSGKFDAALERIDKMAGADDLSGRLLKAEVLEQAGRLRWAREAFAEAVAKSNQPAAKRQTTLSRESRDAALEGLKRVELRLSRL